MVILDVPLEVGRRRAVLGALNFFLAENRCIQDMAFSRPEKLEVFS